MDKLKMQTPNRADDNFKKLAALFPNAVTETINENGEVVRAIDKDVLMQEINTKVVEGREERYQFTWPDKKKSVLLANAPINKTLRPCREESVDFDNTENLYIEGDNLEVLKLLQETYLGKIKRKIQMQVIIYSNGKTVITIVISALRDRIAAHPDFAHRCNKTVAVSIVAGNRLAVISDSH